MSLHTHECFKVLVNQANSRLPPVQIPFRQLNQRRQRLMRMPLVAVITHLLPALADDFD